ncbi:substrate-binding periplasmic protein [Pseudoduganella chitinolytica]|uniref:Transporter substrate-binding domain-containing protein n=1 Tax=Pseudoduganella chitinolytica TaxID=34070 RepID=A0ABY8B9R7_9BURK|nr:transporter substrate-binding domain-containing protein [Pseudoduganella chitinolytica]WEF32667.1 transporter substrate-binding domain-containing protein [Pseudoduganella chitinolytica]
MTRLPVLLRRYVLAACLPAVSLLSPACAGAAPLRVGGFVVAPLIVGTADVPLRGALRDFLERRVVSQGVPLQWMPPTSLRRAMESLRNGTLDVLLLTSGATDRGPGIGTFGWTYLRTRPHLAVRRDSALRRVPSLRALAGMEIGWVAGSAIPPGLDRVDIHWQPLAVTDWQAANLRKLRAGRLDAVFFENEYSPRYYARQEGVQIRLVPLPMPERTFFMAYSLKADRTDIARFDRVASEAFSNEQFRRFLDHYRLP